MANNRPVPVSVPGGVPQQRNSLMSGLLGMDPAPWMTMGAGLLAAGAPTTDPGHFGRTLGQTMATTGQQFQAGADKRRQQKAIQGLLAGGEYTPQQQAALTAMDPSQAMQIAGAAAFQQPKAAAPQIEQAADGYKYFVDGPNAGQRVFADVQAAPKAATPKNMWAYDREAGSMGLFPESTVAASPTRFTKEAPKASSPGIDSGELRSWANDFDKDMAGFDAQSQAYQRLENIFDAPGDAGREFMQRASHNATFSDAIVPESQQAAADIALVFAFMKTIDPGSTVREGEFATASNAGTVVDSVRNMYNSLLKTGGRLTDEQRQSFLIQANRGYQQALSGASRVRSRYEGLLPLAGMEGAQDQILYDLYQPRFSFNQARQGGGEPEPPPPVPVGQDITLGGQTWSYSDVETVARERGMTVEQWIAEAQKNLAARQGPGRAPDGGF